MSNNPNEGWPIFAEWKAAKAKPGYGGNSISERYLDAFNARTDAYMQRIGARPKNDELPPEIAAFFPSDAGKFDRCRCGSRIAQPYCCGGIS